MKTSILLHGCCDKAEFNDDQYPTGSNSHWFPWLQKQLIKKGISTQTPEMPTPFSPEYEEWSKVFGQFTVDQDSILVGHSCASGFLIRWLQDHEIKINKLILVAPWLDPIKKRKGFLDFELDPSLENKIDEIHIFYSDNDSTVGVKESVEMTSKAFPKAVLHHLDNRGHFTLEDMDTVEFAELLDVVLN